MDELDQKLNATFDGKVLRKDLLHRIKKGTNVPTFVLEFLLAKYCASNDQAKASSTPPFINPRSWISASPIRLANDSNLARRNLSGGSRCPEMAQGKSADAASSARPAVSSAFARMTAVM